VSKQSKKGNKKSSCITEVKIIIKNNLVKKLQEMNNTMFVRTQIHLWDSIPARLPTASDGVVHDIIFHQEKGLHLLLPLSQDQWQEEFLMEKRPGQKMNTHINEHQIKLQSIELQMIIHKNFSKNFKRRIHTHL